MVKYLVRELKADPNCIAKVKLRVSFSHKLHYNYFFQGGIQPIHCAIMNGSKEIVQFLVDECKVNPDSENEVNYHFLFIHFLVMILQKGTRPVFLAQMNNDWDMIQLLDERYGCSIEVALHQVGYTTTINKHLYTSKIVELIIFK